MGEVCPGYSIIYSVKRKTANDQVTYTRGHLSCKTFEIVLEDRMILYEIQVAVTQRTIFLDHFGVEDGTDIVGIFHVTVVKLSIVRLKVMELNMQT